MTGNDVFSRVLNLLGYINSNSVIADNENLMKRAPDIINQICLDLKIPEIVRLSDDITASSEAIDALYYGTAMLMSLAEGDGAKNKIFAEIYNGKRAAALCSSETIKDSLPKVSYGS